MSLLPYNTILQQILLLLYSIYQNHYKNINTQYNYQLVMRN